MIIRDALRCGTCGTLHVVRIGMGQEEREAHRFSCRKCKEGIAITLMVDYENTRSWVECDENAERAPEEPGAEIVNLDANFLIPAHMQGVDLAFPRFSRMQELADKMRGRPDLPQVTLEDYTRMACERPYRRPDYAAEWRDLRKAWNLHRNRQMPLSRATVKKGSALYYASEPLSGLPDWVWRLSREITASQFEPPVIEFFEVIKPIMKAPGFKALAKYYAKTMAPARGIKYYTLLNAYFNAYSEFSQAQFSVTLGLDLDAQYRASSSDFDKTRMFYGNAFEVLADVVDLLALVNNLVRGRAFDEFETLTLKRYYEIDKSKRFAVFAATPAFAALCIEADNQLRNASHHNDMSFDAGSQIISYRTGKGSDAKEQSITYTQYLTRCVVIFMQVVNLLRIELILGDAWEVSNLI